MKVLVLCAAGGGGDGVGHGGGETEAGQQSEGAERASPGRTRSTLTASRAPKGA